MENRSHCQESNGIQVASLDELSTADLHPIKGRDYYRGPCLICVRTETVTVLRGFNGVYEELLGILPFTRQCSLALKY